MKTPALLALLALLSSTCGCRNAGPVFRPMVGVEGSLAPHFDDAGEVGAGGGVVADLVPLGERWSLALAVLDVDFKSSGERRMRVDVARVQLRWHGLLSVDSEYGPEDEHPGYLALGVGHVFDARGADEGDYGDGEYVDLEIGWRLPIDKNGWVISFGMNAAYANVDEDSGGDVTSEALRGSLVFGVHWSL